MDTREIVHETESRPSGWNLQNPRLVRVIQIVSQVVTAVFLAALGWTVFQAVVNGNPVPLWAWLGLLTLLAVAVGLGVMVVVYRSVSRETGPIGMRPAGQVAGELRQETRQVDAAGARALRSDIQMTLGVLRLSGGAAGAMEAEFTYDDADWKPPEVDYAVDADGLGALTVRQGTTHRPAMRQGRCEWTVRLNEQLPTELRVKFGAGDAEMRLAGMAVERLRVDSGVGELALDLSGEWAHNLEAFVKAGIGDTTIRLPRNAGVRVQTTVNLGSVKADGLARDGSLYTNAAYGQVPVTLDITVEGAMGKLTLAQED